MESPNPSRFSPAVAEKKKKPLASPVTLADVIQTPEKPAQLPRRGGRRSLVFSDDATVSLGSQRPVGDSDDRWNLDRFGEGLAKKERKVSGSFSDSACKPLADGNLVKLPEKYEIISEFFNCMDTSIRLLKLKGSMPTFSNISASVQHLTERRFSYRHLAQLKHILPEAILIKKVLLRDEVTCCMKPELLVTIQVDAVESNHKRKSESASSVLRNVFRSRIVEFVRSHQAEDDIPEETLPHPFDRKILTVTSQTNDSIPSMGVVESSYVTCMTNQLATVSHVPPSFQRRFSGKTPIVGAMKTPLACLNEVICKDASSASTIPSPIKCSSKSIIHNKSLLSSPHQKPSSSNSQDYDMDSRVLVDADNCSLRETKPLESTPVKDISTPTRLMTVTPKLQTPKRSRSPVMCDVLEEPVKRMTRAKLFPTPRKHVDIHGNDNKIGISPVEDVLSFLPETLLQDVRDKERKAMQERDSGANQARSRNMLISSLPKFFDSILLVFQSGNRSVMTKQELVHKILSSQCSIVDRSKAMLVCIS
ncbi:CDT1-like protein a, chloroplastic [Apostasia shenzhenica]|uniref:CDT1-like protein a, chloroplastic n=1 Tax=Apostasia shenzhenica TaxID=1088818 RepID=A0A2H9ZYR9_9ASPA|nr:CDT1-like protein a, chloroplastic [Apostasia shenzhenica]